MDEKELLRAYISLTEGILTSEDDAEEAPVVTESVKIDGMGIIFEDLNNLVFKLRSFMESETGDFGFGIETGMQRAAEMIENLVQKHVEGRHLG